ncbi:hypothetical protein EGW08_018375 [Elysia chlorotica]|uniref:D-arabinono-1,4-lactone oxidase C-terminal domain-containing protein n=1 Tax=Elysia chlorotica TaxID=188477 RepID=A0A433SX55_ELYCH|nr:hypothetical protein EGW08_018375 [Elysia chlorotica]
MAGLELNPDCNEVTASGTFGYILLYLDDKPSMRWRFNKTMKLKLVWEISELSSKIEKVKSAFSFNQYKLPLDHASEINQEGKGKHINAELFENETVDAQGSKPTRVHSVAPQRRPKMPPQNRSGETSLYENDNDNDDDFDMASENDKSSKTETVHVSEIDLPKHFQNMHGSEHESSVNAGIHSSINSQIPGPSTQIQEYKGSELYGSIETKTICDNFGLEKKKQIFTLDSRAKQGTLVEGNQNMGSKSTFIPRLVPIINRTHFSLFGNVVAEKVNRSDLIFNFNCLFQQYVMEWAVPRILTATSNSKGRRVTINQCYAPTNVAYIEDKVNFYEHAQTLIDKVPNTDMKILFGDLKAKVGQCKRKIRRLVVHGRS